LVTAMVPVVGGFGWITFTAMVLKQVSQTVNTTAGASTTVHTIMMSLSLVLQVSSPFTVTGLL